MHKLALMFSLLLFSGLALAQNNNIPYIFPLKPGMGNWETLKSGKEMADTCNIPDSTLDLLTTEALVKTCLSYPLLNEVFYANNLQEGIERLTKYFNGLPALFKRKDAGNELFKIYKNSNVKKLDETLTEEKQGLFTFQFLYIELLLSQPEILSNLNSMERIEIAKDALLKYENKKEKITVFGAYGLTTTATLMAKILQSENKLGDVKNVDEKEMQIFLKMGMYSNDATVSEIVNATKKLIL